MEPQAPGCCHYSERGRGDGDGVVGGDGEGGGAVGSLPKRMQMFRLEPQPPVKVHEVL